MTDPRRPPSQPEDGPASPSSASLPAEQVAHIRHDLRTFINHILGYSDMLRESALDDGIDAIVPGLEEVHRLAEVVLEHIGTTLAPTRIDVATKDLRTLAGQLNPLIETLHTQTKTLLETTQTLEREADAGDLHKILQAIQNLRNFVADRLLELTPPSTSTPSPANAVASTLEELPTERDSAAPLDEGRILVVDDVENNRDMLRRRLQKQGYTVIEAANGRQALDIIKRGGLDLVLLDILMPEVDGFEVLRQVKTTSEGRNLPIIMISSLDEIQSVVRCIEMGAEDFLPKPFDPVLLRARVGACLEKKRLRDHELDYMRQVSTVITAAGAVEAGTFQQDSLREVAQRSDALGNLARMFQRMANEVQAREQRLQKQVQQLKIEIDEARKQRQVAEVTETEYFQELKQRAQELRPPQRQIIVLSGSS